MPSNDPHLSALLPLKERLSIDTDCGQLISNQVNRVWMRAVKGLEHSGPLKFPSTAVFEIFAEIHNSDSLILSLSSPFINQYSLKRNQAIEVDIQFQLIRQSFIEWHHAIDEFDPLDLIFPNTSNRHLDSKINELTANLPQVECVF